MKAPLYLLLLLLCLPLAQAALTVEISTDNTTWEDATGSKYDALKANTSNVLSIQNLQADTTYYVRVKNDTSPYEYTSFTTLEVEDKMIALAIVLIVSTVFFFAVAYYIRHPFIRLPSIIGGMLQMLMLVNVSVMDYLKQDVSNLLQINVAALIIVYGLAILLLGLLLLIKLTYMGDDEDTDIDMDDKKWEEDG